MVNKSPRRELPPIKTAATAIRLGTFENSLSPYAALGQWVEENNYQISGPVREKFIVFPTPPTGENAVVELQVPIRPIN